MSGQAAPTLSIVEAQAFLGEYWGKQSGVLRKTELLDAEQVFQALVVASDAYRRNGEDGHRYALYVNGAQILPDFSGYLPIAADRDPEGYEQRLMRGLSAGSFSLFVSGMEAFSPALYDNARAFLTELFKYTGTPAHLTELELFLGRYHSTPGGIHNEHCHNLHWVIAGEKTIYTWPELTYPFLAQAAHSVQEATSKTEEIYLHGARVEDFIGLSIPLRGRAGDILYWPRRFWHVGESPALSLSISIRLYMEPRPDLVLHHRWRRL
jgi:50S ribosomal protein L16 3-hydroxylase